VSRSRTQIIDFVAEVLSTDGWTIARTDEGSQLFFRASSGRLAWNVAIVATEDERIVVYSFIPHGAKRQLSELDEFVGRLNFGMILGNFEVDADDHGLRFTTGVGVAGVELTEQMIRELCYPNFATVERYANALGALDGDASMEQVLALAAESDD
jgi:hypothetical protein